MDEESQKGKTSSYKINNPVQGKCSGAAIFNAVLYLRKLLRVDHQCPHHKEENATM